jgi:TPR repeat protein
MKTIFLIPRLQRSQMLRAGRMLWLLLSIALAAGPAPAQPHATNEPARWLTNKEIRKKWADTAIDVVKQAAEAGDVTAQHYLGMCCQDGDRVTADPAAALAWFRRASDRGFLSSTRRLGFLYELGKGVAQDYAKALQYYRIAADGGDPGGEYNIGVVYRDGLGVRRDSIEAMKWFRRAADHGHPEAMHELYLFYQNGTGVPRDPDEARTWLVKSAEAGSAIGQCEMGYYNEYRIDWERNGQRTSSNNMPEAVRWYRLSADQGHAGGQFCLALCYLHGKGVEQDEERGLELVRQAADQKQLPAMVKLADLYARGVGSSRYENERPMALLLWAGEKDFDDACATLALRYQKSLGTDRDLIAASEWYCRAAVANPRRYSLKGSGYPPSPDTTQPADPYSVAWSLYLNGAGLRKPEALLEIGGMYLTGWDVPQSVVKAWPWLKLAAGSGALQANAKLASIEAQMDKEERKTAEELLAHLVQQTTNAARAARTAFGSAEHQ